MILESNCITLFAVLFKIDPFWAVRSMSIHSFQVGIRLFNARNLGTMPNTNRGGKRLFYLRVQSVSFTTTFKKILHCIPRLKMFKFTINVLKWLVKHFLKFLETISFNIQIVSLKNVLLCYLFGTIWTEIRAFICTQTVKIIRIDYRPFYHICLPDFIYSLSTCCFVSM